MASTATASPTTKREPRTEAQMQEVRERIQQLLAYPGLDPVFVERQTANFEAAVQQKNQQSLMRLRRLLIDTVEPMQRAAKAAAKADGKTRPPKRQPRPERKAEPQSDPAIGVVALTVAKLLKQVPAHKADSEELYSKDRAVKTKALERLAAREVIVRAAAKLADVADQAMTEFTLGAEILSLIDRARKFAQWTPLVNWAIVTHVADIRRRKAAAAATRTTEAKARRAARPGVLSHSVPAGGHELGTISSRAVERGPRARTGRAARPTTTAWSTELTPERGGDAGDLGNLLTARQFSALKASGRIGDRNSQGSSQTHQPGPSRQRKS